MEKSIPNLTTLPSRQSQRFTESSDQSITRGKSHQGRHVKKMKANKRFQHLPPPPPMPKARIRDQDRMIICARDSMSSYSGKSIRL